MTTLQLELQETGLLGEVAACHTKLVAAIERAMERQYSVDQILDAFTIPGSEEFSEFVAMTRMT